MARFLNSNPLSTLILGTVFFAAPMLFSQTENEKPYFPANGQWETCDTSAELDTDKVEQALRFAKSRNSHAVFVLYKGRILAEDYWAGSSQKTRHPAYSVSKSLISMLIGIAMADGKIGSVDDPVSKYLSEWSDKKAHEKIKIKHLLTMTSGLENSKRITVAGALSRNERRFTTSLALKRRPGKQWDYHSSAYRLLFHVLSEAYDTDLQSLTRKLLTEPIGMSATRWSTKKRAARQHNYLTMTARDAGRFGLMMLSGGKWGKREIVPNSWVNQATGESRLQSNAAYGYLWWLNGGEDHYLPLDPRKKQGPLWPNCPSDAYAALGKDDQKIFVVPSKNLVVIRFGKAAYTSTLGNSKFDDKFLSLICDSIQ